jgi:hypothetical protein
MTGQPRRDQTATHEDFKRDEEVAVSSDRSFGFVFAVVFALVGLWPLTGGESVRLWALAIGACFLLTAIRLKLLAPLNRLWLQFGRLLGRVTTPVVMALVFCIAVTPTAIIMRALGKDALRRGFDPKARSHWIDCTPPGPEAATMTRQF